MAKLRSFVMVLAIVSCGPALAVLPPDACVPPTTLPEGPTAQAVGSVTFAAYSERYQSSTPFTVQFWREPCPGEPGKSLLYLRPIPGYGAYVCGGFRIIQNGVQYDPDVNDRLGGSILCTDISVAKTYLIEQDYRDPLFFNSGPVTLLHIGSVSSSAALPAYTGTAQGSPLIPQSGLWANTNELGTGYTLDFKHGVLVVAIYAYTSAGAAQWYLASGPVAGTTFTATLDRYVAGQCIFCAFTGQPTLTGNDGTITINFSSSTSATVFLPGGRVTQIQPFQF